MFDKFKKSEDLDKIKLGETCESIHLEFKKTISLANNKNKLAHETAIDISQFLNSLGGVILIGIEEIEDSKRNIKVAQNFIGVENYNDVIEFINNMVLPIIYPSNIPIQIIPLKIDTKIIIAINIEPLIEGLACVLKSIQYEALVYPYRTDFGKKFLHPSQVEDRMSSQNRRVYLTLERLLEDNLCDVELLSPIKKEKLSDSQIWDQREYSIQLVNIDTTEFELKINGISINIPYGILKETWRTKSNKIGLILSAEIIISQDRKNIIINLTNI